MTASCYQQLTQMKHQLVPGLEAPQPLFATTAKKRTNPSTGVSSGGSGPLTAVTKQVAGPLPNVLGEPAEPSIFTGSSLGGIAPLPQPLVVPDLPFHPGVQAGGDDVQRLGLASVTPIKTDDQGSTSQPLLRLSVKHNLSDEESDLLPPVAKAPRQHSPDGDIEPRPMVDPLAPPTQEDTAQKYILYNSRDRDGTILDYLTVPPPGAQRKDPWIVFQNCQLGDLILEEPIWLIKLDGYLQFCVSVCKLDTPEVIERLRFKLVVQCPVSHPQPVENKQLR